MLTLCQPTDIRTRHLAWPTGDWVMRKTLWWIGGLSAVIIAVLVYLVMTGERGLGLRSANAPMRALDVTRLDDEQTTAFGWDPRRLDAVFNHAATLSSDTLVIVTRGKTVAAFGDLKKPHPTHSIRKALLSAVVGRHIGTGANQIRLDATLQEMDIEDSPKPLGQLQKQATVRHLLKSTSGINHPAAADGGLRAELDRRLGQGENQPGAIWAYNNWDYNALTTILEKHTDLRMADAFQGGIAAPIGMKDFSVDAVTYIQDPSRTQHKAASFRMSARDLVTFGQLYLDKGRANGRQVLPEAWVARITTDYTETGRDDLRWAHGYLWWLPAPGIGLPKGTYWAWGLGNQALFVVPSWQTAIVHQSDTSEFLKRFLPLIARGKSGETAIMELVLACRQPAHRKSEYCIEHRFTTRTEFARLMSLIVAARH